MTDPQGPPEITVVVPTHTRRVWLGRCVDSILRQEGVSFELVVVDDASTDGTREWLATITDPRLQVIVLPRNVGISTARNHGLAVARGRFVMFFDDDDWLERGALATLSSGLARRPQAVAAVGARRAWFSAENYARRDSHPHTPRLRAVLDDLLVNWSAVPGQYLFRTELVRRVGGFDPAVSQCEDRDLVLRLATLGPFLLLPAVVMTYRIHAAQVRPPNLRALREEVARTAIRKLPPARQRHAMQLRRTSRLLDEAEDEFSTGRIPLGIARAGLAVLNTPRVFLSPLVGPWTVRRLGGRLVRRLTRA